MGSLLAAVALAIPAASHAAPRSLTVGFFDGIYEESDPTVRATWLDRSREARAGIVRILLRWPSAAPAAPAAPADPADPAYRWRAFDAAVADAQARGLTVLASITAAPAWAEGPGRGRGSGGWRPDHVALGRFARAAAIRYAGTYRDPASGAILPRIRHWQVWNEPNLTTHLAPQGTGTGSRFRPTSPQLYRRMLNSAYAGIKGVSPRNLVVTAGTAPYGDLTGRRTAPAWWWRELLCLRGRGLRRVRCRNPARFDVLSHHPYATRSPFARALGPDDVAVADLPKLKRILRRAVRAGTVFPRRKKRLWVTEVSWDSRPPDPDGVSEQTHARWLAESFYVLWRQGVDTITWFQVRDQARGEGYGFTSQSGVFFRDGRPKLAFRSFRFPFVAIGMGRGRARVWGKAPVSTGRVLVERRSRRGWRAMGRFRVTRGGLFRGTVRAPRGARLRARVPGEASLAWRVR